MGRRHEHLHNTRGRKLPANTYQCTVNWGALQVGLEAWKRVYQSGLTLPLLPGLALRICAQPDRGRLGEEWGKPR